MIPFLSKFYCLQEYTYFGATYSFLQKKYEKDFEFFATPFMACSEYAKNQYSTEIFFFKNFFFKNQFYNYFFMGASFIFGEKVPAFPYKTEEISTALFIEQRSNFFLDRILVDNVDSSLNKFNFDTKHTILLYYYITILLLL
jgi:hypothetical protein